MNSDQSKFSGFSRRSSAISVAVVLACVVALNPAFAENAQEARVTRIVKDVQLVGGNAAARPATLSDQIRPGNGVRTGTDSRAELTFSDLSITRLGANTVFSFNGAGRTVDLGGGAILVEAPPNSAAIHVNTAAFSAAISGGTGLIEFHPNGISKVMVMEGQGDVKSNGHGGEVITVPAGEMITLGPDGKWIKGQKFNVALVMKSSNLITDFGALPNEQLIFEVIEQQKNDFGGGPGANRRTIPRWTTRFPGTMQRRRGNRPHQDRDRLLLLEMFPSLRLRTLTSLAAGPVLRLIQRLRLTDRRTRESSIRDRRSMGRFLRSSLIRRPPLIPRVASTWW